MSLGLLITVSTPSARPSLRYCLTRLCLERNSSRTSLPEVKTRLRKMPGVVFCTRRAITAATSGRPMPTLSATSASKKPRARRG